MHFSLFLHSSPSLQPFLFSSLPTQSVYRYNLFYLKKVPFGIVHFSSRGRSGVHMKEMLICLHTLGRRKLLPILYQKSCTCDLHILKVAGRKQKVTISLTLNTLPGSSLVFQENTKNQFDLRLEAHWTPKQTTMTPDHQRSQTDLSGIPNFHRT